MLKNYCSVAAEVRGIYFRIASPCCLHFLHPRTCLVTPRIPLMLQNFSLQNNEEAMKLVNGKMQFFFFSFRFELNSMPTLELDHV
jgi:hypothetical protein